jgi:hypothetical protein
LLHGKIDGVRLTFARAAVEVEVEKARLTMPRSSWLWMTKQSISQSRRYTRVWFIARRHRSTIVKGNLISKR